LCEISRNTPLHAMQTKECTVTLTHCVPRLVQSAHLRFSGSFCKSRTKSSGLRRNVDCALLLREDLLPLLLLGTVEEREPGGANMMEETIVVVKKVDRAWQQWKCDEEMNTGVGWAIHGEKMKRASRAWRRMTVS
jgi:hypothetical protein